MVASPAECLRRNMPCRKNPTQFVEPMPRFNVVRVRGVSPTCMWTAKAPLRRGFLLGASLGLAVGLHARWNRLAQSASYVSPGTDAGFLRPALLALALLIGGAQC